MTFTEKEIKEEKITVSYDDEWQINKEDLTVDVLISGFENRIRRFCNLKDDYGEDWIDVYFTIDPVKGVVTEIYMHFVSNCDEPDRELQITITNYPEGKMLLDELLKNDAEFGEFRKFIKEMKEEWKYVV